MSDVMSVCTRLNRVQRENILARFYNSNPHWRGAHVEDILDALDNYDSNLVEVEAAWDAFPRLHGPGFGSAVRALVWSGDEINEANLKVLLGEHDERDDGYSGPH